MVSKKRMCNRLIDEKSPYLLQHAYNPVDWYAWGDEAFEKAKAQNKPVFLSIGYSTCHWCHVMEKESFEDDEVAQILNEHFISIKVDKEERPDIDSVYMAVCQAFNNQGGWPLNVIMTPEQKPFFAGTYFPKKSRFGMIGLVELLTNAATQWQKDPKRLSHAGGQVAKYIKDYQDGEYEQGGLSKSLIKAAKDMLISVFDDKNGGFGTSPKFPTPHNLMFLMRYSYFNQDNQALEMVEKTLRQMYRGGIFDHAGGGFSRYSTDERWLAPHFEKMLYDNALLSMAYIEAFLLTKDELYKGVSQKILNYVLSEMRGAGGGFFCAQDADSEGEEGRFYVFTYDEIIKVLGEKDGRYFNDYYNVTRQGNFEGENILNLLGNEKYFEKDQIIEDLNIKLYDYRQKRAPLHKDDKVLTSWNALMVCALIKAYRTFKDEIYKTAALEAMDFIKRELTDENGRLYVRYRDNHRAVLGHLDDYAFYVWALIEMYDATHEPEFLKEAQDYCSKMIDRFYDKEKGGFFLYANDAEQLIYRPKDLYDGAIPSGNSVAAYCLIRLARLLGSIELESLAIKQMEFIAGNIKHSPANFCFSLMAFCFLLYDSKEVVCVVKDQTDAKVAKDIINDKFLPNASVFIKDESNRKQLEAVSLFVKDYTLLNNESTFYICENKVCSKPFSQIEELQIRLQ